MSRDVFRGYQGRSQKFFEGGFSNWLCAWGILLKTTKNWFKNSLDFRVRKSPKLFNFGHVYENITAIRYGSRYKQCVYRITTKEKLCAFYIKYFQWKSYECNQIIKRQVKYFLLSFNCFNSIKLICMQKYLKYNDFLQGFPAFNL